MYFLIIFVRKMLNKKSNTTLPWFYHKATQMKKIFQKLLIFFSSQTCWERKAFFIIETTNTTHLALVKKKKKKNQTPIVKKTKGGREAIENKISSKPTFSLRKYWGNYKKLKHITLLSLGINLKAWSQTQEENPHTPLANRCRSKHRKSRVDFKPQYYFWCRW